MRRFTIPFVLTILVVGITEARAGYLGKPFPKFEGKDALTGDPVRLEDFRGKVVLVDFWATWCGPCVRELPNVKKAYRAHKNEGFEIISISLDSDTRKFKRFVGAQKMRWHHIMSGKGWKSPLARRFNVTSIPRMYVIDHEGICVSESARGPALERTIKQALAKIPGRGGDAKPERSSERTPRTTSRRPAPKRADADPAVVSDLRRQLETASDEVREAAEPVRTLRERLDAADSAIAAIRREMPSPRDARSVRTSFERVLEDLAEIRHELFLCGFLNDRTVVLPDNPFADGTVEVWRAAPEIHQRLDPVQSALTTMNEALQEMTGRVRAAANEMRELDRRLRRDADRKAVAASCSESATLVAELNARFDEPWKHHLQTLDATLAARSEPAAGPVTGQLDVIDALIESCERTLTTAGAHSPALIELRQKFATLCAQVSSVVEHAVARGALAAAPPNLPENPLRGGGRIDLHARIDATKQLELAARVSRDLRTALGASSSTLDGYIERVRALQGELRSAEGDTAAERDLEVRFNALCREILAGGHA